MTKEELVEVKNEVFHVPNVYLELKSLSFIIAHE